MSSFGSSSLPHWQVDPQDQDSCGALPPGILQVTVTIFIINGRGLSVHPKSSHFSAVAMSFQLALVLHPLDTKRGLAPQVGLYLPFMQAFHSIS